MPRSVPNHSDSISDKGAILCNKGKYKEGIRFFDLALRIDKQNVRILRNKAKVVRILGDNENADKCDEEADTIESNHQDKK
jgi:tetratricopeptide (TPR) repeat protein